MIDFSNQSNDLVTAFSRDFVLLKNVFSIGTSFLTAKAAHARKETVTEGVRPNLAFTPCLHAGHGVDNDSHSWQCRNDVSRYLGKRL